jgi:hypothetical protein
VLIYGRRIKFLGHLVRSYQFAEQILGWQAEQAKNRRRERVGLSLGIARREVPLFARPIVNFHHQRLQRAKANFAKIPAVVRHELLTIDGAIDAHARPSKIVVGFAKAAITDKSRFGSHDRIRAVIGTAGNTKPPG